MSKQLLAGIARIFKSDRISISGVGIVITHRNILTCSHVIQDSANKDTQKWWLDFPLLDTGKLVESEVIFDDEQKDIAVLDAASFFPNNVIPLPLVPAAELWGHHFRVFGFPKDFDQGVWVHGELLERNACGWVQMIDPNQPGHAIEPGYSGGPVWDEELEGVVGMVVAADQDILYKTGYCIPTTILWQVCQNNSLPVGQTQFSNALPVNLEFTHKANLQMQAPFHKPISLSSERPIFPDTPTGHLKSALNLISQVQTIFQESRVLPSECDIARSRIKEVWDKHVTQAYALLEADENLDEKQQAFHESLRVSLELIHDNILLIIGKIAAFRQIAQETRSETTKQIHQIQGLLDKLMGDLQDILNLQSKQ